ncbi:protein serine/threonine kinase-1, putative [Plasmodium relictum]|uniref:Protein serine/threonine kinase-1, putative n=1 Tax=Plasmodium relictum TaxID=85471 RepID=A0A1J1H9I9_PLARL|nr:protein serine/threonine kinase-1, putative [Plasmodium relictum]CRH01471.1 protein serine/threonine kinase-1, putative [Plasmodium relictum]
MFQNKYNDSEKNNKYKAYNYCRNYVNDIKNKYMGFSNIYKNSPNKYYYDSKKNNNYRYNNNYNFKLRNKRHRSYRSISNSKHRSKFTKYKNYDIKSSIREYDRGRHSFSSIKTVYNRDQRNHKFYLDSRYNEDHKNRYVKNYNLSKKRNYYSYKKRIYSDKRNFDTHYGQGNIFYNNEYYLINDGSSLKKKKMYYAKCSIKSKSRSYNSFLERKNKKRLSSRNNKYTKNDVIVKMEENNFNNETNNLHKLKSYDTKGSSKKEKMVNEKENCINLYKDKIKKNSESTYNNYMKRTRKRGKNSSSSLQNGSYIQKKKVHVDKLNETYKKTISKKSNDTYSRKKNIHKRNRTKNSETEEKKEKKKKKKKKENDSDDEIVHFNWKKGMILNDCYIVIRKMGDGTFGRVLLCQHKDTKKYYAIKVVRNIKKYTKSAKIEADILKKIQNDDIKNSNIVKFYGRFMYHDHMCLIFEPLGPSLYEIITKNNYNGFHIQDIKLYCIEILKALNYLRKITLTHTDLKPENILLDDPYFEKTLIVVRRVTDGKKVQIYKTKSTGIKLIDFGCATFKNDYHGSIINTRQYRAPEVILNLGWDVSSDMWSFGCVLAELYTGSLLFRTHEHLEHLAMMENIIQPIPKRMLYEAIKTNGSKYVNKEQLKLAWPENASSANSIKHVKKCLPLYKIIKHELFCDFLYNILQIDPSLRPTPEELLKHKFLQEDYEYLI